MTARPTLMVLFGLAVACSGEDPTPSPESDSPRTLRVCTTLYPVHYFAERIAGDLASVECVIPADGDPLHWQPKDDEIRRLQGADLILFNGADAETWAFALMLPFSRIVETAAPFADTFITREGLTHSHGGGATHTHEGIDPHTWVDPRTARRQAEEVLAGLIRILPDHEDELRARYDALAKDLDGLHDQLAALGAQPDGEVLLASHPAYGYPARRHGWRVVDFDFDPAATPSADDLGALDAARAEHPARIVLWEQPPSDAWLEALRERDLEAVVFSPCETLPGPGEPDWLAAMRANVARLTAVWR